jgi:hypothetical protein
MDQLFIYGFEGMGLEVFAFNTVLANDFQVLSKSVKVCDSRRAKQLLRDIFNTLIASIFNIDFLLFL